MSDISQIKIDTAKMALIREYAAEMAQYSTETLEKIVRGDVLKSMIELSERYTPGERRELGMRSPAYYRRELRKLYSS